MSCSIYYKRAYIDLFNDKFIPLVLSGLKDTNEDDGSKSSWNILLIDLSNNKKKDKIIYSKNEIISFANNQYDNLINNNHSGFPYKSAYRPFTANGYKNWIINGLKSAKPINKYIEEGMNLSFTIFDEKRLKFHCLKVDSEITLYAILEELKDEQLHFISLGFNSRFS